MKEEKRYILTNLVSATPMTKSEFKAYLKGSSATIVNLSSVVRDLLGSDKFADKEGYAVNIAGDVHWIPKKSFESMTIELVDNKTLPSGINVGKEMVDEMIQSHDTITLGNKTTVVRATLKNGFEMVESSGCVDEENYDTTIGEEICLRKIKKRIWEYLGFLLQTAWKGIY